jgi:hypothetical protein
MHSRHACTWIALIGWLALACRSADDVLPVYLTWSHEDTSTTMTVHYHTVGPAEGSHVYYDVVPRGGDPAAYAYHATGFKKRREGVDRSVHVVELTDLEPGTSYHFVVGDPLSGFREERRFRTLRDDASPIRFVVGGDMGTGLMPRMISARAAAQNPDFALLGGDISYASGRLDRYPKWPAWFADWEATMRTPDGHLIPMVVAVGNHETNRLPRSEPAAKRAPFYTLFFHQHPEGQSYFLRRFGAQVALWVLDSGHLAGFSGAQEAWLERSLREHRDNRFRFALYHVSLYPSHRPYDGRGPLAGRQHWVPHFDAFGLTAAFEHHEHLLKRSHPLREGAVVADSQGTLYLGDGCWGKSHVREPVGERWYLAKALRRRHVWSVSVSGDEVRYTALGAAGQVYDEAVQRVGPD